MKITVLLLVVVLLFAIGFLGGVTLRVGIQAQQGYIEWNKAGYDNDIILTRLMLDFLKSPDRFQKNVEDLKSYTRLSSYKLIQRPGYESNSGAQSLISSIRKVPAALNEPNARCSDRSVYEELVIAEGQFPDMVNTTSQCRQEDGLMEQ